MRQQDMEIEPVREGERVELRDLDAKLEKDLAAEAMKAEQDDLVERLADLQWALYAEEKRALLVVLQARDTGGKDGAIRKVFGPLDPQGCVVTSFKQPTPLELAHDFLWRVHLAVPPRGTIGVFNRSHYEDVLVVRVRKLVPTDVWQKRYEQINDFEQMLTANGVTILKFFLHISKDEQKKRLQARLEDPRKNWKFKAGDLDDRALWDSYTAAYEDALSKCSTPWAPWYVVPADKKAVRDYLISKVLVSALERMDPQYPRADPAALKLASMIV